MSDDTLYDAVLSAGELSPDGEFLGNNARIVKVVAKDLTYAQIVGWICSPERRERYRELHERGERILVSAIRRAAFRVRLAAVPHAPGEPPDLSQRSLDMNRVSSEWPDGSDGSDDQDEQD
jgi:hypothetical protein